MTRLEELEKQVAEIQKEIEVLKNAEHENENNKNKPADGTYYYWLNSFGRVGHEKWGGITFEQKIDNGRFSVGNVFLTREEAEFEAERLKVVAELRKFAAPNNASFKNKHFFSIVFDHDSPRIVTLISNFLQHTDLFFESEEIAEKAIKKVGEDMIIKYYFRLDTEADKEDEHD